MIFDLVRVPNSLLKEVSKPIEKIDNELLEILDNMLETMYAKNGIGLAGVQVGMPKRIFVIDLRDKNVDLQDKNEEDKEDIRKRNPRFFINPEIIWQSEEQTPLEEGCLSIPNQRATINRPEKIKVKYLNRKGDEQVLEADGLLSKCIQHEIDHLNGKLFIDKLSKLKKDMLFRKAIKFKKQESFA